MFENASVTNNILSSLERIAIFKLDIFKNSEVRIFITGIFTRTGLLYSLVLVAFITVRSLLLICGSLPQINNNEQTVMKAHWKLNNMRNLPLLKSRITNIISKHPTNIFLWYDADIDLYNFSSFWGFSGGILQFLFVWELSLKEDM